MNKNKEKIDKVVLAYSGGLDTSVILKWLEFEYDCEVITFTADIGQGEELEPARAKAQQLGIKRCYIEDLSEEFIADYVFPMFRGNALYEGQYMLGTSIARPLIAKRQIEIAQECGCTAVAHGATGKGNDQVRFELGYLACDPNIKIIAPWRLWHLNSREMLMHFAREHGIPVDVKHNDPQANPYSMDANLLHISYEGGELEDPSNRPVESMWLRTASIADAPANGEEIRLRFRKGDLIAINGEELSPAQLLSKLNTIAGAHAIGRSDIVENRVIGMKSRGCYETPGGSVIIEARRALQSMTMDREVMHLCDDLMPRYATMIYNGFWFSPERILLQGLFDQAQQVVNGEVCCLLQKGNVVVLERQSDDSLYDIDIATFEQSEEESFSQADSEGFIKINSLRLRLNSKRIFNK